MTSEQQLLTAGDAGERRQLSANQEFFCAFDRGNELGAFGPRNPIVAGWRLHGRLDVTTLQLALSDIVARHEGLRTAIIRDEGNRHARVHPQGPVELVVFDLSLALGEAGRERHAHVFLNEIEGSKCDPVVARVAEISGFGIATVRSLVRG